MFKPRWKKEAKHVYKAGKKFLNYKRDLLKEDRIAEIESRLRDLKEAMKGWGSAAKEQTAEAVRQLDNTCESALPKRHRQEPIGENIEVIFVSLVVALGIRSYYIQPFRIPTGSMQPTLNGVICHQLDKEKWPNIIQRTGESFLRGRNYVYKEAKEDLIIPESFSGRAAQNPGLWKILQTFHTVSVIKFENGTMTAHGVPLSDILTYPEHSEISIFHAIEAHAKEVNGRKVLPKGTVLYSGYADSGDLILADKVSYHFRKPRRGETFIFDTRGIKTDANGTRLSAQGHAQHYIKRCVGVPGDTLQINPPYLLVNGQPAEEPYMQRVARAEGDYSPGYTYATPSLSNPTPPLLRADQKMHLQVNTRKPWKSEYAAMGDNTQNSLDSRYWGALEEYNVVAPALFSLWPITTGHWGIIK